MREQPNICTGNQVLPYTGKTMENTPGNELCMNALRKALAPAYKLATIAVNEDLDDHHELLFRCIRQHNDLPIRQEIVTLFSDVRVIAVHDIQDNLRQHFKDTGYDPATVDIFFDTHAEEIQNEIFARDKSDVIKALLEHTLPIPVCVELCSNYDCINSHWFESQDGYSYNESYFGDMVDTLNLNPSRLKWLLNKNGVRTQGKFPCLKERNGKELVAYTDFYREIVYSHTPENLLVFMATLDPMELYNQHFNINTITIPKGNKTGLFSKWSGGGSLLEMSLLQPLTIHLDEKSTPFRLSLDINNDVKSSIRQIFGKDSSFFGSPLSIAA